MKGHEPKTKLRWFMLSFVGTKGSLRVMTEKGGVGLPERPGVFQRSIVKRTPR